MAEACVKLTEVERKTKCARCDCKRAGFIAALEPRSRRLNNRPCKCLGYPTPHEDMSWPCFPKNMCCRSLETAFRGKTVVHAGDVIDVRSPLCGQKGPG